MAVDQAEYAKDLLRRFDFTDCRSEPTPASTGTLTVRTTLSTSTRPTRVTPSTFLSVIGALLWLALITRPDIAQAVGAAARHGAQPTPEAIEMVKRILRYLAGSLDRSIVYSPLKHGQPLQLKAYSDSDWGGEESTGTSTSGMLILLNGTPVSWSSRRQKTIALSSTEAEYVAASEAAREIQWIRTVLAAFGVSALPPTPLLIDNRTAIQLIAENNTTDRRKHINIKYHYIRQQAELGVIAPEWVPTADQLADIFTKPLPRVTFIRLRDIISSSLSTSAAS